MRSTPSFLKYIFFLRTFFFGSKSIGFEMETAVKLIGNILSGDSDNRLKNKGIKLRR